ncbi:matrix metalloproteinase-23-like [Heteronotia binoei]|uniref:matrix metalloproteinase-23-like n=1 Tax=Heteronotia binoei TaxID=13085 RepID=UPI002930EEED|nr:matrix metalloproteinase-23-like [Heteronotia binoei]
MPRWHLGTIAVLLLAALPAVPWILQNPDSAYKGEEAARSAAVASGIQEFHTALSRRRRYAISPEGYKWDHVNLTYKIVQFPSTLNRGDTETAIAKAFRMWSDVSPLTFRRLPPTQQADISIGFYTFNHTDCWFSSLHPCFDGLNGELAHAFLPPRGEIHFDNHEFWILGRSRFSWKQGVWLNDLVQVAAHEIGHALGLWHSRDIRALMHPNATYSRTWRIGQDDVWAIQRLYGCVDEKRQCPSWAQQGFCTRQRKFMKRHCPRICNACFEHPAMYGSSSPPARPPLIRLRFVSKGRVITFRCGLNSSVPDARVSWYKDGEPLYRSLPGFELLPNQDLHIIATELSEGRYACLIRHAGRTLRVNSWQVKLKAKASLRPKPGLRKDPKHAH